MLALCLLPTLMNAIGLGFGASSLPEFISGDQFHTLLEWSGVGLALAGSTVYWMHHRAFREPISAFVGLSLFVGALFGGLHTLAAVGLYGEGIADEDVLPFTGAFAVVMSSGTRLIGLGICLVLICRRTSAKGAALTTIVVNIALLGAAALCAFWLLGVAHVPRTTFPEARVTRPFDLAPLTLLIVGAILAWSINARNSSGIARGVLMSTIPAVFAQAHVAFETSTLYDNHFNVSHVLRMFSEITLLACPIADMAARRAPRAVVEGRVVHPAQPASAWKTRLSVGFASRPLGVVLPLVAFAFTLGIVLVVALGFYTESERLVHNEKWAQVDQQSEFIGPIVERVFEDAESGILLLSRTSSVSNLASKAFGNASPTAEARVSLEDAFAGLLQSVQSLEQIRYLSLVDGQPQEIVRVRRMINGIVRVPQSRLRVPPRIEAIRAAASAELGEVSYSGIWFQSPGDAWVSLAVPLFDAQNGEIQGVIEADLNVSGAVHALTGAALQKVRFLIAREDGQLVYNHYDESLDISTAFEDLFPDLRNVWDDSRALLVDDAQGQPLARILTLSAISRGNRPRLMMAVGAATDEFHQTLVNFRNRAVIMGGSVALLALALALIASSRIVRPLRQMSEALEHHSDADWLSKLPVDAKDEVGVLARGFHNLFGQLEGAMSNQRAALLSAQNQRQALDEHAIVAMTDVNGLIIYANERFCSISGHRQDELIGDNHSIVASGSHDEEFWRDMYTSVAAGKNWHGEICNRRKDGNLYWVDSTIVPFMGEDGRPESYVNIATDITERVLAERELGRSVALLAATLDSTTDGILVTDVRGRVLQANERLCKLFNWPRDDLLADEGYALHQHMEAQLAEPYGLMQVENQLRAHPTQNVAEVLHFTNERIYERDSKALLVDGRIEGLVFSYRDVTTETKARLELIAARDAAESASRQKADFLASMSHEIRTPMNGVLGMLDLLMDGELQPEQRHEAELAHSSAVALLSLINDILDFSKVEAGKLELEALEFDLCTELGEFSESMALRCEDKGLSLVLDMVDIDTPLVVGDPGRLRQILMNLVGNAIKFTDDGEILLSIATMRRGSSLRILGSVKDGGIGIPEDKVDSLFDKFTQVDASTTRKYGGSGLGLAIVGQLCELMNGRVSVESTLGVGSVFSFEIELQAGKRAGDVAPRLDMTQVLVVDDGPQLRDSLGRQLRKWGAQVTDSESIESVTKLISRSDCPHFQTIFFDLSLAKATEFSTLIRSDIRFAETRLVAMTTLRHRLRGEQCLRSGFDASFPKPITMTDLARALNSSRSPIARRTSVIVPYAPVNAATPQPTSLRLLIVEDNPVNQKVARGTLTRLGYSLLDVAGNGREALEALKNAPQHAPYDLVLMDCQMPEMDGYEAVRRIRQGQGGARYKDLPVIAMTANAMAGDREKCIGAGMSDYLTKPVQREPLRETLLKWLPGSREDRPQ